MSKPTILIVEDDGILAIHLEDLLVRQGYQVLKPVPTGEMAIREVVKQNPDLVLMDIELAGEMNGIEAAEQITAETDTPVIFLTGFSQDPLLQQAKIATPYGYLVKPVPERELAATIEMALYKHKIDHQIKVSEAKYRSLIEQASDGIFLSDRDGNYIEVNSAGCSMLGYTREEILKMNMRELVALDDLKSTPLHINEILGGGTPVFERIFMRKDGSQFPVEISGKMLENGTLQGIVRNITERKLAEEALKQSNERFDLATRAAHLGVWDWDIIQNNLVWDDSMYQLYGIKKDAFTGAYEAWLKGLHPEDVAANNEISEQARRGEREYDPEFRVIWPDGSIHWIKALGQVIRAADGTPLRMTGINFDITRQKETENIARRNEMRLRGLLDISQYNPKNIRDFLSFALNKAIQLTESKIGYIFLYDDQKKEFALNAWSNNVLKECSVVDQQTVYQLETTGLWGEPVRQRKAIVNNNFAAPHPLKKGVPEGHVAITKILTIPVFVNQVIVAVVGVANKPDDYDATDELQLTLMMDAVWKIVERTRAQEQIRLESAALNAAANAIVITNLDGIIEWANPAFTSLTGYSLKEAAGKNPRDLIKSGRHPRKFYQDMWDTILAGQVWTGEMINRRKDGTLYNEEMIITPLRSPDGKITQFIAIKQDITERIKAQEIRHQLEEKFTKAFHASPDAIAISSLKDGRFIDINDGFLEISGYSPEELIGKTSNEISIWLDPAARENVTRELQEKEEVNNWEMRFRIKNGKSITCLLSARLVEIDGEKCILSITRDISDRKQMEETLRYSEERYRLLFEEMAEGFALHEIIVDEKGAPIDYRFLDVNPAFELQTGLKRKDVIGRTVKEVLPQTEDYWIQSYGQVALTGKLLHYENYAEALGKWFNVTAFSPKFGQFAVTFQDITERKTADLSRSESEERFRQLAENIHEVFWLRERDSGKMLYVSPIYEKVWGRTRESLYQNPLSFMESIHPDDQERIKAAQINLQEQGIDFKEDFRIVQPDGKTRWVRAQTFPVRGEDGKVIRFAGIAEDITENRLAEDALKQSQIHFQSLIENAPDGIALLDKDYKIKYVSPSGRKNFGYSEDEMMGISPEMITHPDDLPLVMELLQKNNRNPSEKSSLQYRFKHKDGTYGWISSTFTNLLNEPGVEAVIINFRDITAPREAELKIQEQLDELRRWNAVTLGRENRILELKQEVNQLRAQAGLSPLYAGASTLEQNHD